MNKLDEETHGPILTYRCLDGGLPPRRISVQRPGWGGEKVARECGAAAQPWHCAPFSEGASYGFELLYPFKTRCEVTLENGRPEFVGDFSSEQQGAVVWPPFQSAHPNHYSIATLVDIKVPSGYSLRVEPHPSFFSDMSGSVPAAVIGNIQTTWWPLCIFVTFKSPVAGQKHIFERGLPFCQVVPVLERPPVAAIPMEASEIAEREITAQAIMKYRPELSKRTWISHDQLRFDDTYKQLRRAYQTGGTSSVRELIVKAGALSRRKT